MAFLMIKSLTALLLIDFLSNGFAESSFQHHSLNFICNQLLICYHVDSWTQRDAPHSKDTKLDILGFIYCGAYRGVPEKSTCTSAWTCVGGGTGSHKPLLEPPPHVHNILFTLSSVSARGHVFTCGDTCFLLLNG